MRGGYGIFYDWFDANTYEQTVRVDGTHQIDEVIINPSYPDLSDGSGTALPASRILLGPQQTQPTMHQASIGYDRAFGQWGNFRTDYMMMRGTDIAALDQHQRAGERRAARSAVRQHQRDPRRPASARSIASPSACCCACPIAASWAT